MASFAAKGEKPREGFWRASPDEIRGDIQTHNELEKFYGYLYERLPTVICEPKRELQREYQARVRKLGYKNPWISEDDDGVRHGTGIYGRRGPPK